MALCKIGLTLCTKTCARLCDGCEHYDSRNKKEREREAREVARQAREQEIESYCPSSCGECIYHGYSSWDNLHRCTMQYDVHEMSNNDVLTARTCKELLKGCPLKHSPGRK